MTILQADERQDPPEWLGPMLALILFLFGFGTGAIWQMHKDHGAIRAEILSELEMSTINAEENRAVLVSEEGG